MMHAFVEELVKLGAVSDEHAQRAVERLDSLEKNHPTVGQLGRYGAIGAVAGPAISAVGNILEKKPAFGSLRNVAASAVKGGLGASTIPLARVHFDRKAEIGTLNKYVAERSPSGLEKGADALAPEPKKPQSNLSKWVKGTGAHLGFTGATLGMGHLSAQAGESAFKGKEKLFKKVRAASPVPVIEHESAAGFGGGAFHFGDKNTEPHVVLSPGSKSPAMLAHELGHADIHGNRFGRVLQNKYTATAGNVGRNLSGVGGFASGALTDDPTTRRWAIAAPAIATAPQLAFEAGASIAGLRRLRAAGAGRAAIRNYAKTMAPAFGSYLGGAGMGVARAYAGQAAGAGVRDLALDRQEPVHAGVGSQ